MRQIILLLILFTAIMPLYGEVYLSLPRNSSSAIAAATGSRGQYTPADWQSTLGLEKLWEEEFFCNSRRHILCGGISRGGAEDFLNAILQWQPQPAITVASDGLLFKWQDNSLSGNRLFWRPPTGNFPGIWFHLTIPERNTGHILWPTAIPHPGGIVPRMILEYPARGGIFVEYTSPALDPAEQFRQWATALYADGWESLSQEGNLPWASGEMLIHHARGLIALLQTGTAGGNIYIRPL